MILIISIIVIVSAVVILSVRYRNFIDERVRHMYENGCINGK